MFAIIGYHKAAIKALEWENDNEKFRVAVTSAQKSVVDVVAVSHVKCV